MSLSVSNACTLKCTKVGKVMSELSKLNMFHCRICHELKKHILYMFAKACIKFRTSES